ncbi:MAG: DNA translocase FtsK [bacterium]|nr:DNA translocase FtsK [bacterium]
MKRRHMIRGLSAILFTIVVIVSIYTFQPEDWPDWSFSSHLLQADNAFGFVGALIAKALISLIGNMAIIIVPPLFLIQAGADFSGRRRGHAMLIWTTSALLILLWAGSEMLGGPQIARIGWLGMLICEGLQSLTGATGSQIILFFLSMIGVLAILPVKWVKRLGTLIVSLFKVSSHLLTRTMQLIGQGIWHVLKMICILPVKMGAGVKAAALGLSEWTSGKLAEWRESRIEETSDMMNEDPEFVDEAESGERCGYGADAEQDDEAIDAIVEDEVWKAAAAGTEAVTPAKRKRTVRKGVKRSRTPRVRKAGDYILPSFELLNPPEILQGGTDRRFLEEQARTLVEKLASFNIGGKVSAMSTGPVVTTYEFEPETGVKVSQIVSRREDLALAMRCKELRMVAPIPGKAAVGVEVPNPDSRIIYMREVLEAKKFLGEKGNLALALGVDVDGKPYWTDLSAMPHMLVAGATGTGKSVCINSFLISLLLAHTPETLRLFLIDPKMLELSVYNDIPHLLHPVITDNRVALQALNWLVGEMERRYQLLKPAAVRSIEEYNNKVKAGDVNDQEGEVIKETLPFLVAVVEEFADLIMTQGKDIQTPIIRLAQMARAVGIHLVLATQRPSVDIIDGVIKANFPSRVAFKVFSRFDSKTILDGNGAESLIGRGDMLFKHGRQPIPVRVHGAFISTEEVEKVVSHWRDYKLDEAELQLEERGGHGSGMSHDDPLYNDALEIVVRQGFGSTTMLQRRLRIGYTRASRIMDMLEDGGIVGPHTGSKAREVLVGPEVLSDIGEDL